MTTNNGKHPAQPRKVTWEGQDAKLVNAIAYGKTYKAAGALSGSTVGQVSYRLQLANRQGVGLSPRTWRESALPEDERKLRELNHQFSVAERVLTQLRAKLPKKGKNK